MDARRKLELLKEKQAIEQRNNQDDEQLSQTIKKKWRGEKEYWLNAKCLEVEKDVHTHKERCHRNKRCLSG